MMVALCPSCAYSMWYLSAIVAAALHLRQPSVPAGSAATDQIAEQLRILNLQREEDRQQQAERLGQLQLEVDALGTERNRASQTSQAEADIGRVSILQMLYCPPC